VFPVLPLPLHGAERAKTPARRLGKRFSVALHRERAKKTSARRIGKRFSTVAHLERAAKTASRRVRYEFLRVVLNENGDRNDGMEELRGSPILDRGERFLSCWEELAAAGAELA